jgi:DNA-binding transcriptional ArsR family regulator
MPTDQLSRTRLSEGEATVSEIAEPFPMSLPAISRHLKVLEGAGLIVRSREAQWRPSRMEAEPLDEAMAWMQSRKRTWEARMDRLDAHLRRKGEDDD